MVGEFNEEGMGDFRIGKTKVKVPDLGGIRRRGRRDGLTGIKTVEVLGLGISGREDGVIDGGTDSGRGGRGEEEGT